MKRSISILLTLAIFLLALPIHTFAYDPTPTFQTTPDGNVYIKIDASSSNSNSSSTSQGFSFKFLMSVVAIVFLLCKLPLRSIYSNLQGFKDKISNFFSNNIENCSSTYTWGCLKDSIRNNTNSIRLENTEGENASPSKFGVLCSIAKIISLIAGSLYLPLKTFVANKGPVDITVKSMSL